MDHIELTKSGIPEGYDFVGAYKPKKGETIINNGIPLVLEMDIDWMCVVIQSQT